MPTLPELGMPQMSQIELPSLNMQMPELKIPGVEMPEFKGFASLWRFGFGRPGTSKWSSTGWDAGEE